MSLRSPRGMSLIDVLVGSAITLIIFVALFGLLRASLMVSSLAKSKAIATAVANSQMEYVRSLPYDSIGTIGGIPAGVIEETSTTTSNNLTFVTRTFVQYVDDAADGLGASDQTGIITDYKRIKVTVAYSAGGTPREVELISNHAPIGLETTTGGGTLLINVVNALGAPVAGASVDITNPSTNPTVDLTAFTNSAGLVYLPGAATSTDYHVSVSKSGYSTAQTYARDATNQNPTPGYLTVVQNQTTSSTFAIDQLTSLTVRTFSPVATSTFSDSFTDNSKVSSTNNTDITGGSLILSGGAGTYVASGSARSDSVTSSYLAGWSSIEATLSVPPTTSVTVRVLDGNGTLIPDAVLSGNSAGFTAFPVSLTGLSTTTYPTLMLEAELTSSAPTDTPTLSDWTLTYREGPIPLPNISFSLTGNKTVGSTGGGSPIYKTTVATSTGATAAKTLSLEWDAYAFTLSGYDIVDACSGPPYALSPGSVTDSSLVLGTNTSHMILVTAKDDAGAVVPGATVTLSRTGYSETVTASSCGTAYFGGLTSASDYTVTISKTGYTTTALTNVSVSGKTYYAAIFD